MRYPSILVLTSAALLMGPVSNEVGGGGGGLAAQAAPDPATIELQRARWAAWRQAHVDLCHYLCDADSLSVYAPTPPDPARFPAKP